ncbi:MAG: type II toxin-antitoxin system Phd/YefM family antitoxin [Nitrospira sp.]|nr:type II toxin-antitoxin system Phd/YefM family antitoxin [Nitrospira sp.]
MPHVDQFVSVTEAKNKLPALIRNLKLRPEVVAITRDGVPAAVLLSMDQFEGFMETIEILSDEKTMRAWRRATKQAKAGKWVSHEAAFGREAV